MKRVLLVSSSGGVLLDLLALQSWWSKYHPVWAVVKAADTQSALEGQSVHWIHDISLRRPLGLVPGSIEAWRVIRRECPDLIVSAGSAPAISYFFASRILGIPTFWLSTLNVLTSPGISGEICAGLASRVLLQQPAMLKMYPNGIVIGELY